MDYFVSFRLKSERELKVQAQKRIRKLQLEAFSKQESESRKQSFLLANKSR